MQRWHEHVQACKTAKPACWALHSNHFGVHTHPIVVFVWGFLKRGAGLTETHAEGKCRARARSGLVMVVVRAALSEAAPWLSKATKLGRVLAAARLEAVLVIGGARVVQELPLALLEPRAIACR